MMPCAAILTPYKEFCTAVVYLPPAKTLWLQHAVIKFPSLLHSVLGKSRRHSSFFNTHSGYEPLLFTTKAALALQQFVSNIRSYA